MLQQRTVLVVEDSTVQAMALSRLLEQQGIVVLHAPDGLAGIALAERCMPDGIILDIQMPVMDGLEACRQLKHNPRTAHIPVVILTGHSQPDILKAGMDLGAVDFIPKDAFSDTVLIETLRQLGILEQGSGGRNGAR